MDESKKRYLFVKKVKIKDKYKTYIVTRHYEKELTQDELMGEIQVFKARDLSATHTWRLAGIFNTKESRMYISIRCKVVGCGTFTI